jgi:MFS family permease
MSGAKLLFFIVPACVLVFGFTAIAQGFVNNWSGLLATRFFLGFAEAGVFPGCFYLIAMYISRLSRQRHNDPDLFD